MPMFTGMVEATADILDVSPRKLTMTRPSTFGDIAIGSSIAVSGVCLSIVELTDRTMAFDVTEETLRKSALSGCKVGDTVNLERALKVGDRFDGHVVQGHSEGVGKVVELKYEETIVVQLPDPLLPYVTEKGSIALDGVSLTVARLEGNRCTVALIPHTIASTTLGALKEGDSVNVETDVLVRSALSMQSAT